MVMRRWLVSLYCFVLASLCLLAPVQGVAQRPDAVEQQFADQLRADDAATRLAAVSALARIASPQAAFALIDALESSDEAVRVCAAQFFSDAPSQVFDALLAAVRSTDAAMRRRAMLAFGSVNFHNGKSCAMIGPLLTGISDADRTVREAANRSFEQLAKQPSTDILLQSARRIYGQPLRPRGLDGGYSREDTLVALGWAKDSDPVPLLITALQSTEPMAQRWAAWLLGWLDQPQAISTLATLARTGEPVVRTSVVEALGRIFTPSVIQPLVAALPDPDADVRCQAANSLGNIHRTAAFAQLNALDHYVDAATQAQGHAVQQAMREANVTGALSAMLKDPEARVRAAAAAALAVLQKEQP